MSQKDNPRLTITLTGRAPVEIIKEQWPVIASSHHQTSEIDSQADHSRLTVRQHADGRAIVYGVWSSQWANRPDRREGELLAVGDDITAAIERVAEECGYEPRMAKWCIADLPAVQLA